MKHVRNTTQVYSGAFIIGLGLLMMLASGWQNMNMWFLQMCAGVVCVVNGFVFEEGKGDERDKSIKLYSMQTTFYLLVGFSFVLYTALYFSWITMESFKAILLITGIAFLIQSATTIYYARKI